MACWIDECRTAAGDALVWRGSSNVSSRFLACEWEKKILIMSENLRKFHQSTGLESMRIS